MHRPRRGGRRWYVARLDERFFGHAWFERCDTGHRDPHHGSLVKAPPFREVGWLNHARRVRNIGQRGSTEQRGLTDGGPGGGARLGGHVGRWGAAGRLPRELDGRHTQHGSLVRPARLLHGWRRSGRRPAGWRGGATGGAAGAPVPSWVAARLGSGEPPEAATGETGMEGTMGAIPTMVLFKSFAPGERPAGPATHFAVLRRKRYATDGTDGCLRLDQGPGARKRNNVPQSSSLVPKTPSPNVVRPRRGGG